MNPSIHSLEVGVEFVFQKIMLRATPPEEPRSGLKRMCSWLWYDHLKFQI